jgi:acyl-coenzyme A synthetase/AMP-(fatty) acid ligase
MNSPGGPSRPLLVTGAGCVGPWGGDLAALLAPQEAPPRLAPVPSFIESAFGPLVSHAVSQAVGGDLAEPRTAFVLASTFGDTATADLASRKLVAGLPLNALLFYQSIPNSILGHLAQQYGFVGPLTCLAARERLLTRCLAQAELILEDEAADRVVVVAVELAPDERIQDIEARSPGRVPRVGGDMAAALVVRRDPAPAGEAGFWIAPAGRAPADPTYDEVSTAPLGPRGALGAMIDLCAAFARWRRGMPAECALVDDADDDAKRVVYRTFGDRPAGPQPGHVTDFRPGAGMESSKRTAISGAQRTALAADARVGAGTWFPLVLAQDRDLDTPVLWTDEDWPAQPGAGRREFSLHALKEIVDGLAARHRATGVRPRDPVAVYSSTAMDYYANHLALTGLGAIPVLVNRALPAETAAVFMQRVGVVGVLADETGRDALSLAAREHGVDLGFLDTPAPQGATAPDAPPDGYPYRHDPSDPVLITHSSGTTGVPKAVPMQHGNFFTGIRYRLGLPVPKSTERVLCALPAAHNSAITQFTFSLISGLPIRVMSTQEAPAVLRAIEEFRPTMVAGFSTTFADLSESDLDGYQTDSVQLWWNSGDAAHERHIRRLQAIGTHYGFGESGPRLVPGSSFTDALGSSEMGHSLFNAVHRPGDRIVPRCVGRPLEFVEAAVLAPDGSELPAGEVGMLGIKSPTLTTGYWNDSLQTFRSRLAGYWLTGDLVSRDAAGQFYHLDRVTDAVAASSGPLYSLRTEELLMSAFPQIADCTIIGVDEGREGEEVYAFLQPAQDVAADDFDATDWTGQINVLLKERGWPLLTRAVRVARGDLPLGPTLKVKKRELRDRHRDFLAAAHDLGRLGPTPSRGQ